jgi:HSP20 family protein
MNITGGDKSLLSYIKVLDCNPYAIKKEEVKIDLNDNTLTISGERKSQKEEIKGTWHYTEIRQGKFSRSFIIPENIMQENIEANFADGMLEIVLPKAEHKQAKAITIK